MIFYTKSKGSHITGIIHPFIFILKEYLNETRPFVNAFTLFSLDKSLKNGGYLCRVALPCGIKLRLSVIMPFSTAQAMASTA